MTGSTSGRAAARGERGGPGPAGGRAAAAPRQPDPGDHRHREPAAARRAGGRRLQPAQAGPRAGRRPDRRLPALRQQGRPRPGHRRPADRGGDGRAVGPAVLGRHGQTEIVTRLRATYRAHPGGRLVSASGRRSGPAEMRVVNVLIGAVLQAGFEGAAGGQGLPGARRLRAGVGRRRGRVPGPGHLACSRRTGRPGRAPTWPSTGPSTRTPGRSGTSSPSVTDDDIFDTILSLVVDGFLASAPRPCTCAKHVRPDAAAASAS